MNTCITSDLHLYHQNIIKYCPDSRGRFSSVKEMNEALVSEWNEKVQSGDTIYHLGDFSFGNGQETANILRRLNGTKIFIRGNHERGLDEALRGNPNFGVMRDYKEITHNKTRIVLFHFPQMIWNRGHHGALHFHGHCHGSINHLNKGKRRIDVGWDARGGRIISMEEAIALVEKNPIEVLDHHDGKRE